MMEPLELHKQIRCAKRALALRRNVYPGLVRRMKMSQEEADDEIALMQAIVETLTMVLRQQQEAAQMSLFG